MKNKWSRISRQPQRWAQLKLHRRDILKKWANMFNRPPSHSEMRSTRCCITQEKQDADDREVGSKSIHRVLEPQYSSIFLAPHSQEETLDLRTPGCAESQGWECRIIGVCITNCGMPGLAEAIIRVCISSWLGARMTTTAPCLAASVVQRKNWPEFPSVSWVLGTKLPPFHF